MKRIAALLVILLVAGAGCGGQPSYALRPLVEISDGAEDPVQIDGAVVLEGRYGDDLQVEGVIAEVRLDNGTSQQFALETLNQSSSRANFSLTATGRPTEIRVYYRNIEPSGYSGTTYYLQWDEEDQIYIEKVSDSTEITPRS